MKITVKTLSQQAFHIEANESDKVSDIKSKIQESQGYDVESQKLIFKGRILANDASIESLNIGEKDFLVVMVSKPKTVSQPSQPPKPVEVAKPTPAPAPAPAPAPVSQPAAPAPASSFAGVATGPEYENAISNLCEMGFPRDQVVACMRAAFNNPDRAAEYLMTGIPENLRQPTQAAAPAAANQPVDLPPANPPNTEGQYVNLFEAAAQQARQNQQTTGQALDPTLEMLRNSPQFAQIRQMVQNQPELLQPLLQQLGNSNPEILQLISRNQDQFLSMLNDGSGGDDLAFMDQDNQPQEQAQYITITPEEDQAINRLVALGFERQLAVEAFFACDKNEELAANYLFDNGGDWQ